MCNFTHKPLDGGMEMCIFTHMNRKRRAPDEQLTRRERQIMDIVYASGRATAKEIGERLPDAPTDATVRTLLRVLLEKGHLRHRQEGRAFVYEPVRPAESAAGSALRRLVDVFFSGSPARVMSCLLDDTGKAPAAAELDRMEQMIRAARRRGKQS